MDSYEPYDEEILSDISFENWDEPPAYKLFEQTAKPPIAKIILDGIQDAPPALRDWVEKVVPNFLSVLAFHNAKGMSETEADRFLARSSVKNVESKTKAKRSLVAMPDQSLAVHTLNAALGGWTVVVLAGLGDMEQRLYLAGITMHDLNKMLGTDLRLQGRQYETYEKALKAWSERLGLWTFLDNRYWSDVAFLAQNAEAVRGENRTAANYPDLQTPPEDLEPLTDFVRLGDLLASGAKHPDDVLNMRRGDKVKEIIQRVLRGKYRLRYHKTADNRGLTTQLIHNAVLEQAKAVGWLPFLYFSNGVTYLAPKESAEPDLSGVPSRVRHMLIDSVADKLGQLVNRDGKGLKFSSEFTELLTLKRSLDIAIKRLFAIVHDKKAISTDKRKASTRLKPGVSIDLDLDYPSSLNVDRLAEGLLGIVKLLLAYHQGDRAIYEAEVIEYIEQEKHLEAFNAINVNGGTFYNWYYVAGHYLRDHTGFDVEDVASLLQRVAIFVIQKYGEPEREPPFGFLEDYIGQTLSMGRESKAWDFAGELSLYTLNKKPRSGKQICAICNSSFNVRKDYSTFSNKKIISAKTASERGICEICQAETLLRRFTLGRTMLADDGTKFIHFYPTYFFTPITAKVLRRAYDKFKQAVFTDVIKPYQQAGYEVGALLHADVFQILEVDNPKRRLDRVDYPEGQMHGYYLLGIPFLGRDPSDTENWVMPALLALLSPLLFGTKTVVSDSAIPLYTSGADFPETVVLDAPHSFWQHGVKKTHFRLDELKAGLQAAIAMYGLLSEAYKDGKGYAIWNQLGSVARRLDSDPLSVFGYADRISSQQSKGKANVNTTDGMTPWLAERLAIYYDHITNYYQTYNLGGKNEMELIKETVDKYTAFYRAKGSKGRSASAYSRLRPFSLAVDVILRSPTSDELDDASLRLQINGNLLAFLDRIRSGDSTITAYIPAGRSKNELLHPAVQTFTDHMVDEVFGRYCNRDRAILRKRLNDLKNGCEAYYILHVGKKDDVLETQEKEQA